MKRFKVPTVFMTAAILIILAASTNAEPLSSYAQVREVTAEEPAPPERLDDYIRLDLYQPDYQTANQIRQAIEDWLGPDMVIVPDQKSVWVQAPRNPTDRVTFLAALLALEIDVQ